MSLRRCAAVARLGFLAQLRDSVSLLLTTLVPFVLIPFMMPAAKSLLIADGYVNVTGAEQTVPGMAVLFSFLAVQSTVMLFSREHAWGTWERLRVSAATKTDVVLGKLTVAYLTQAVQIIVVLLGASLLFGFRPTGSIVALALVTLMFAVVLSTFGVALALWTSSEGVALSLSNLIGMLAAGVGGALGAVSSFPGWAQPFARFSPAFWALDAVHAISLDGASLSGVAPQIGMLAIFAAALAAAVVLRCVLGIDGKKTD